MAAKRTRLTQKEKDFNRKYKKELQEKGVIPPDKKRLNRRKFIDEAASEWNNRDTDCYIWDFYLMRAVEYMTAQIGRGLNPTPEAVGAAKVLKAAMKLKEFQDKLREEGREDYTLTEEHEYIKEILKM